MGVSVFRPSKTKPDGTILYDAPRVESALARLAATLQFQTCHLTGTVSFFPKRLL